MNNAPHAGRFNAQFTECDMGLKVGVFVPPDSGSFAMVDRHRCRRRGVALLKALFTRRLNHVQPGFITRALSVMSRLGMAACVACIQRPNTRPCGKRLWQTRRAC
jgi:hypothetical protein